MTTGEKNGNNSAEKAGKERDTRGGFEITEHEVGCG
jgi:hypothetical protein